MQRVADEVERDGRAPGGGCTRAISSCDPVQQQLECGKREEARHNTFDNRDCSRSPCERLRYQVERRGADQRSGTQTREEWHKPKDAFFIGHQREQPEEREGADPYD